MAVTSDAGPRRHPLLAVFLSPGRYRSQVGLLLGPLLFTWVQLTPPPSGVPDTAWSVLALTLLMATWWITEALPIAATALLPIALLPLMGVETIQAAAAPYANPLIFLFLGGFLLATAIQRWGLHRRLALAVLSLAGSRPDQVVGGFMVATAMLSMWVSNTATSALMLPIGLSVLGLLHPEDDREHRDNLGLCLLLGIALGANIGGMGTLIGTPPNAVLAGYLASNHGITIGFGEWMLVAFPLAALLLFVAWWLLTRRIYPIEHIPIAHFDVLLDQQRQAMGSMSRPEKAVLGIFLLVAVAWLTRPLLQAALPGLALSDAGIAVLGALLLFVIPVEWRPLRGLLDWSTAQQLPWGVLLLVGGGLSLGGAIESSGLAQQIARALYGLDGWPLVLIVAGLTLAVMLVSHVTSNTATAATMVPIAASLAITLELPLITLTLPVAFAASCAFMLPVSTPPNAIIFSSERITIPQMARAGAVLSLVAAATITVWVLVFSRFIS
ncbi:DASS family sodium-coupled anion symporter [Marinobacteraceae bacterium S3BR75-40.1]